MKATSLECAFLYHNSHIGCHLLQSSMTVRAVSPHRMNPLPLVARLLLAVVGQDFGPHVVQTYERCRMSSLMRVSVSCELIRRYFWCNRRM